MKVSISLLCLSILPYLAFSQLLMPMVAIQAQGGINKNIASSDSTTTTAAKNFLLTFVRNTEESLQNEAIKFLEASGATIKQLYDYKVYKGILFTVEPSSSSAASSDSPVTVKDINWWSEALKNVKGVKGVEEEQIVTIQ